MKVKSLKAYSYKSASSPGKMYITLLLENGEITCNCPGWAKRVAPDGSRTCKHCEDVKTKKDYRDLIEKVSAPVEVEVEEEREKVAGLLEGEKLPVKHDSVPSSERVGKMFNILREYGYMCFRNYFHRRGTAIKTLRVAIEARAKKDIPVSGCVWVDRVWTRDIDGDIDIFKVSVYVPDGNVASVMYGEIKEAAQRSGLEVTSEIKELASFGLVILQKTETVCLFETMGYI